MVNITDIQDNGGDQYYVESLPGFHLTVKFYNFAGHISVKDHLDYFFWLVHSKNQIKKLTIWLNGGPGCSSMDGMFLEVGPYRPLSASEVKINLNGWQTQTNLLFLDQPSGTGFSRLSDDTSSVNTIEDATATFMVFLEHFYTKFPHMRGYDLYLAGESYAAQYIPYYAKSLIEAKEYNLKGILIGGGYFDAEYQDPALVDYVQKYLPDLVKDTGFLNKLKNKASECKTRMESVDRPSVQECETVLSYILDQSKLKYGADNCINQYYIQTKDKDCGRNWPYELKNLTSYLRQRDVLDALNLPNTTQWQECSSKVYSSLGKDFTSSISLIPFLTEHIQVYTYAGEYDLICNYMGIESTLENLQWNGAKGFQRADKMIWSVDNSDSGYSYSARNLTYFMVNGGSHMTPYDHPREAMDMLQRLIGNTPVGTLRHQTSQNNTNNILLVGLSVFFGMMGLMFIGMILYNTCRGRVRRAYKRIYPNDTLFTDEHDSKTSNQETIKLQRTNKITKATLSSSTLEAYEQP
jgi:carboxypeptidase D